MNNCLSVEHPTSGDTWVIEFAFDGSVVVKSDGDGLAMTVNYDRTTVTIPEGGVGDG